MSVRPASLSSDGVCESYAQAANDQHLMAGPAPADVLLKSTAIAFRSFVCVPETTACVLWHCFGAKLPLKPPSTAFHIASSPLLHRRSVCFDDAFTGTGNTLLHYRSTISVLNEMSTL